MGSLCLLRDKNCVEKLWKIVGSGLEISVYNEPLKGTIMILCISFPFQTISVIQGKYFSTPYRPTNGRLNYAKESGNYGTIYSQLIDCPVTYQDSRPHTLRVFAWTQNLLWFHREKPCYPINNLIKVIPLGLKWKFVSEHDQVDQRRFIDRHHPEKYLCAQFPGK